MVFSSEVINNLDLISLEFETIKGYVNFVIFSKDQLDEGQIGYSTNSKGQSLITEEEGSWNRNWIVIGYETMCGDPIIIDLNEEGYPVSSLLHGIGSWEGGTPLAASLDSFYNSLKDIGLFISEEKIPEGNRKVQSTQLKELVDNIVEKNSYVDFESWESLLSPLFDMANEYEKEIKLKIKEMADNGEKISDIANSLGIQAKDVYKYMKEIKKR